MPYTYQWRIQDFPEVVTPTTKGGADTRFCQISPKTAWNWKKHLIIWLKSTIFVFCKCAAFGIFIFGNGPFLKMWQNFLHQSFCMSICRFFQKPVIILENLHDETNAYSVVNSLIKTRMCIINSVECISFLWQYFVPHCQCLSNRQRMFSRSFCRQPPMIRSKFQRCRISWSHFFGPHIIEV